MMLVLHLSRQFASHVGPWIHVITSLANEKREPWDPTVEIAFEVYGRIMEACSG